MPSPLENSRLEIYEDSQSPVYDRDAKQYADHWRDHNPDMAHYHAVQGKMLRWYQTLGREQHVHSKDGALVICGPGFDIAHRDLTPPIITGIIQDHPEVIVADWSPDVLKDAHHSLTAESRTLAPNLHLARRDFSGGLSTKLHSMLIERIEEIRSVDQLNDFMAFLENEVGVEEVSKHQVPNSSKASGEYRLGVRETLDVPDALCFDQILKDRAEVRFITANMLLAGTFALTESDFRDRLKELDDDLSEEQRVKALRVWHKLILELNNTVAENFVLGALEINPHAHIFAPTDINVNYDFDNFRRLDVESLRSPVEKKGYKLAVAGQWTQDDSAEWPSHTHEMNVILACRNGSQQAAEPDVGAETDSLAIVSDSDSGFALGSSRNGSTALKG